MDVNKELLEELKTINRKLEKLETIDVKLRGIEKTINTIQKDISNVNDHIEKGIYVDLDRVKERLTKLEQKSI